MSDHEYQRERRRATAHAEVQQEAASLARVRADAARAALDCVPVALERLCPGIGRVSADERARLALAALAFVADAMLDAGKLPAFRALLAARAQAHGDVAAAVAFGAEPPTPTATVNLSPAERAEAGLTAWVKAGAERWEAVQRAAPTLAEDVTLDALRRDVGEDGGRER